MNKKRKERIANRKALTAWSLKVRLNANNTCQHCGSTKFLQAHHIIPKEVQEFRLVVQNGLCLCVKCHKFGLLSAHKNAFYFINWLRASKPQQYAYLNNAYRAVLKPISIVEEVTG